MCIFGIIWLICVFINCILVHMYDTRNCELFFAIDSDEWMKKEWFRFIFMASGVFGTLCWLIDKLYFFSHYNSN